MITMTKTRLFIKTLFVFCFLFLAMTSGGYAANLDLVLQWDENIEPDLATGTNPRYKIYYKTGTSGAGIKSNFIGQPAGEPNVADEASSPVNVTVALDENPDPAVVQFTLHNLEDTQNYYIAVTALDEAGNESELSNEVVYEGVVAPVNQVPVVSTLTVNGASGSNFVYTNNSTGTVSVRVGASDTDGMINQYLILANDSNPLNGTFVNTPAGTLAAQDFTVNFNLPTNGTHTVYAWVKDDDGNISAVVSKSNVVLDGILNYTDADNDNDGMPDAWETQFGLNPTVNDAAMDDDGDGVSNLDEYLTQSNPTVPDANISPEMPVLLTPQNDAVVSTTPELAIGEFIDSNSEDYHAETEWEVYLDVDGTGDCLYNSKTSSALKTLPMPSLILDAKKNYAWRARVYDNRGAHSEWSDYGYFTTGEDGIDANGDGIIDDQITDPSTDINQDGIVDNEQVNVVSIKVKGKGFLIGMDATDSPEVLKILSFHSLSTTGSEPPGSMPYGLIDFKVQVHKPGDSVTLVIFFSEALPNNAVWYKYDSVNDEWQDASSYATISRNRLSLSLILQDGGPLDADGLANGMIIDPSGIVAPAADDGTDGDNSDPPSASSASGGGGGGCFIQSVQPGSGNALRLFFQWTLISGILILMRTGFRKKATQKRS
jgi:hypothetical protein